MEKKICFMYTGQGSQYFGMCKNYYEEDEVFREWMDRLNAIALGETGKSVIGYLYGRHDAGEICDEITMTHLAIVMVEYAMTESLRARGIHPDVLLGSSLGEYSCMAVAGLIKIKELIRLLVDQSYLLKRKCPQGGMAAVIAEYHPNLGLPKGVEIAAIDYDRHFVISGNKENVGRASVRLKERGVDVLEIPVRYGFHSESIACTKQDFMKMASKLMPLPQSRLPIISSCKCRLVDTYRKDELWEIIRNPIRFQEAICNYCSDEESVLVDVGPSATLAGFCKNILKRQKGIYGIISPFHVETRNVQKIIDEILS